MNKSILTGIIAVVTLIIAVGGVIWAAEDRFLNKTDAAEKYVDVQTIQQMQVVLDKRIDNIERKALMQEFTFLTEQYYIYKDRTLMYTGDQEILEEFERIQKRRDIVMKELGL